MADSSRSETPRESDVILGRTKLAKNHPGNALFRQLISRNKVLYACCKKRKEKKEIVEGIISAMQEIGGRFMQKDATDGKWSVINEEKVYEKISQALREGRPKLRNRLSEEHATSTIQNAPNYASASTTTPNTSDDPFLHSSLQLDTTPSSPPSFLPTMLVERSPLSQQLGRENASSIEQAGFTNYATTSSASAGISAPQPMDTTTTTTSNTHSAASSSALVSDAQRTLLLIRQQQQVLEQNEAMLLRGLPQQMYYNHQTTSVPQHNIMDPPPPVATAPQTSDLFWDALHSSPNLSTQAPVGAAAAVPYNQHSWGQRSMMNSSLLPFSSQQRSILPRHDLPLPHMMVDPLLNPEEEMSPIQLLEQEQQHHQQFQQLHQQQQLEHLEQEFQTPSSPIRQSQQTRNNTMGPPPPPVGTSTTTMMSGVEDMRISLDDGMVGLQSEEKRLSTSTVDSIRNSLLVDDSLIGLTSDSYRSNSSTSINSEEQREFMKSLLNEVQQGTNTSPKGHI